MEDPFYALKEEVDQSIQGITSLYKQWQTLLQNSNTATSDEFKWAMSELKNGIQNIEPDLADLEQTIIIAEKNQAKFGVDFTELENRKAIVAKLKKEIKSVKDDLQSTKTRGKMENDQRTLLISQKPKGDRFAKLEEAIVKDNDAFLDNEHKKQQQIMQKQDETLLPVLQSAVGNLKEIGTTIDSTLKEHERLIDDIDKEANKADSGLRSAVRKVNELLDKTNDKIQWTVIIVLIVVLVGLAVLVYYV